MSAAPAATPHRTPLVGAGRPVWVALGLTELRRLVLHPVFLGGPALLALLFVVDPPSGPRDGYVAVTGVAIFLLGPLSYFAANLLGSRDRRNGAEEWLSSLPARRPDRTAAALLAGAGPMAVVTGLTLVLLMAYAATDALVRSPHVLEVASGPLGVLGGCLLGVMVARWAPFPGAALLVMIGLVALHIELPEDWRLLGAYVEFAPWGATAEDWVGVIDGSRVWHAVYLAGLCAMAAIGALLVDVRRKAAVLVLGVVVTGATALAGWAQLP